MHSANSDTVVEGPPVTSLRGLQTLEAVSSAAGGEYLPLRAEQKGQPHLGPSCAVFTVLFFGFVCLFVCRMSETFSLCRGKATLDLDGCLLWVLFWNKSYVSLGNPNVNPRWAVFPGVQRGLRDWASMVGRSGLGAGTGAAHIDSQKKCVFLLLGSWRGWG